MNWRAKLWFFNSGSSVILAVMLAVAGHSLCFVFGALGAFYWHLGNVAIELYKQGE